MDVQAQIGFIIDEFEGTVFSDDADDYGNATRYGISRALLSEYLGLKNGVLCPVERVRELTRDDAIHVGVEMIALRPGLYRIADDRLRFIVLDMAFNSGVAAAVRALQQAVGVKAIDGVFGPNTEQAVAAADADRVGRLVIAGRLRLVAKLVQRDVSQVKWLGGWLTRIGRVLCSDALPQVA